MSEGKTGRSGDSIISAYFTDVSRQPQLSFDEQKKLFTLAQKGDKSAQNKIVSSYLKFVISVAKKFTNRGLDLCDLIAEGNLGLFDAIQRYDFSTGNKFDTYAVHWIKMRITTAIEQNNAIHVPHKSKVNRNDFATISLDLPVEQIDGSVPLIETIADSSIPPVHENLENEEIKKIINKIFKSLSDKEKFIINKYFGFESKPISYKKIGDQIFLSKESVRLIQIETIKKLQEQAKICGLKFYISMT